MEVYWIEVEYKPQSGCSQTKEPGVVYVFVKSKDAITAHYAVKEALNQQKLDADKRILHQQTFVSSMNFAKKRNTMIGFTYCQ